jgi:hypothetical protein
MEKNIQPKNFEIDNLNPIELKIYYCKWERINEGFSTSCVIEITLYPDADESIVTDSFHFCYNCGGKTTFEKSKKRIKE